MSQSDIEVSASEEEKIALDFWKGRLRSAAVLASPLVAAPVDVHQPAAQQ